MSLLVTLALIFVALIVVASLLEQYLKMRQPAADERRAKRLQIVKEIEELQWLRIEEELRATIPHWDYLSEEEAEIDRQRLFREQNPGEFVSVKSDKELTEEEKDEREQARRDHWEDVRRRQEKKAREEEQRRWYDQDKLHAII